ncbi:GTP-binding protein [Aurantimonas sp. VKM B-3413]|uniref:CobW family GTP-binding protein n=1 Tax=Aurantimonas sp. VKM B-3413 TaxID=2779401 RepID=UPI001E5A2957|nr:GTP-binding protein [Aurantimonas sp. VKM B-3413]MCB8839287.1 GTP-binding protein [Aurantimonas sp. VKM B-3413]
MPGASAPIRLTLLTGFLGVGKTTLLNRLLREPGLRNTAVVVNEFGEAAIDPLLVETRTSDGVLTLSDGCLCCSVRGELVETLLALAERRGPDGARAIERVIVETTGLADPGPILAALIGHPGLSEAYVLDGVVTVVDALAGARNLDDHDEARRQLAVADRIVLTKADLAGAKRVDELTARIASLNPRAVHVPSAGAGSLAERLLGSGLSAGPLDAARLAAWLGEENLNAAPDAGEADEHDHSHSHEHGHGHGHLHAHGHASIRSVSLQLAEPVAFEAVASFLEILTATQGERILRMKGIVQTRETPERPLVLHGVRGYLHPPARLAAWPQGVPPQTRLVVIAQGVPEAVLRDLFAAFTGGLRSDAPDRAVLEDNPLAVPGYRFG